MTKPKGSQPKPVAQSVTGLTTDHPANGTATKDDPPPDAPDLQLVADPADHSAEITELDAEIADLWRRHWDARAVFEAELVHIAERYFDSQLKPRPHSADLAVMVSRLVDAELAWPAPVHVVAMHATATEARDLAEIRARYLEAERPPLTLLLSMHEDQRQDALATWSESRLAGELDAIRDDDERAEVATDLLRIARRVGSAYPLLVVLTNRGGREYAPPDITETAEVRDGG